MAGLRIPKSTWNRGGANLYFSAFRRTTARLGNQNTQSAVSKRVYDSLDQSLKFRQLWRREVKPTNASSQHAYSLWAKKTHNHYHGCMNEPRSCCQLAISAMVLSGAFIYRFDYSCPTDVERCLREIIFSKESLCNYCRLVYRSFKTTRCYIYFVCRWLNLSIEVPENAYTSESHKEQVR